MKWAEKLHTALESTGIPVGRYSSHKKVNQYIVWQEDGGEYFKSNDRRYIRTVEGTIDFFTKTYDDEGIYDIENALLSLEDVTFEYNSLQYEEETGYIHHEWVFEILDLR